MDEMGTIRVMVADDLPLLRDDFCEIIDQQADMEVVGRAGSGEEICALARQRDCDVILVDIEMETIRAGIVAAETIHREKPDIKILFLTAHETENTMIDAMASGAVDYVVKGCDEEALLDHIRRAYHDRTTLDAPVRQAVMREYTRLRQSERSLIFFINNVARLTPVEHELVKHLLDGKKVSEIARIRCVEMVTVKTQIKGLLKKFGCSRSKEIVQMIHQLRLEHLFQ